MSSQSTASPEERATALAGTGEPQEGRRSGPRGRVLRALRLAQRSLLDVAAVAGAVSVIALVLCFTFQVRPAMVISGSMEPGIPVGSLTFSRVVPAEALEGGDVATLPRNTGDGLVTHRIVETAAADGKTLLTLQGDANDEPDPLPYRVEEGREVFMTVPGLGYAVAWMQQHLFLLLAALVLLLALSFVPLGGSERPATPPRAASARPARGARSRSSCP